MATLRDRHWERLSERELLNVPLRSLGLRLTDSPVLRRCLTVLRRELAARDLRLKPHFWLSNEWFTPDGYTGIAVPFYLAHPRLTTLEKSQMGRAEGAEEEECLKILRHEAGHALENAFEMRQWPEIQAAFGRTDLPYPRSYAPRPYSRQFVRHLEPGYSQSHPDEDFAETFAVWLDPESHWRERYRGWPALKKLQILQRCMSQLEGRRPLVQTSRAMEPLSSLNLTLGEHYRRRRRTLAPPRLDNLDGSLRRIFGTDGKKTAAVFLRKIRKEAGYRVRHRLEVRQYHVDGVFRGILERAETLGLSLKKSEPETLDAFASLLTARTRHHLSHGHHLVHI